MELAVLIFPDPKERFRRAVDGGAATRFQTSASVQKHIWDTVLYCLSRPDRKAALVARASEFRAAFVDLMLTHPAFETLTNKGTEARVAAFEDAISNLLARHKGGAVSSDVRVAMIKDARRVEAPRARTSCGARRARRSSGIGMTDSTFFICREVDGIEFMNSIPEGPTRV